MATHALIQDGKVVELIDDIDGVPFRERFHADLVASSFALTAAQAKKVRVGWVHADGEFKAPEPVEPPKPPRVITPRAFRSRFMADEKAALTLAASKALEAGDATLQVFLDDLSASQEVDLDHPELSAGMDAIVAAGLISATRAAEILAA